jgi:seryl-tRNA synthetase
MLDIKFIRENTAVVKKAAENKGYKVDIDRLLKVDEERRKLLSQVEELRTKQNIISNTKGAKPTEKQIAESKKVKAEIEKIAPELGKIEKEFNELMMLVPNVPTSDTPVGKDESDNVELKKVGELPKFDFPVRDHVELGYEHDILDTERAVKIGGTRSYILKNELVILEQSVLRYALDLIRKEGFTIMNVPVLVREEALYGSGFFPFGKEDIYKVNDDELYLVGTSEASLVYYYSGETLAEADLPKLLSGITTCFRKEVGTYGKDTKGVIRVHQFNKVEQVVLCKPEDWERMFNFILGIAERIISSLGLPYRLIEICTGDMGAKNAKQIDVEVWFPGQGKYRETHSCSYLSDFQARRANIKYRDEKGNKQYVHTLNNTGIATPRVLGAILENYQQKDGSILVPEVLQKYTGFNKIGG